MLWSFNSFSESPSLANIFGVSFYLIYIYILFIYYNYYIIIIIYIYYLYIVSFFSQADSFAGTVDSNWTTVNIRAPDIHWSWRVQQKLRGSPKVALLTKKSRVHQEKFECSPRHQEKLQCSPKKGWLAHQKCLCLVTKYWCSTKRLLSVIKNLSVPS